MFIKDIVVGERRREDLGDVPALAKSIQQYGLLQPVVIDAAMNLVAGERRLVACQSLEWEEIEVRQLGDLSTQELRLLELEENIRRKGLTPYEKNKAMVELVDAVKEGLQKDSLSESDNESPKQKGGQSNPASQQKVAERTGIPRSTAIEAQAHVETADAFPFMQTWPQYKVLEAREVVATLPKEEHERVAVLINQPGTPPDVGVSILRDMASKSVQERESIYKQSESKDVFHLQQALPAKPAMPDSRLLHLRQAMKELAAISNLSKDELKDSVNTEIGHLILLEERIKESVAEAKPFALEPVI